MSRTSVYMVLQKVRLYGHRTLFIKAHIRQRDENNYNIDFTLIISQTTKRRILFTIEFIQKNITTSPLYQVYRHKL